MEQRASKRGSKPIAESGYCWHQYTLTGSYDIYHTRPEDVERSMSDIT